MLVGIASFSGFVCKPVSPAGVTIVFLHYSVVLLGNLFETNDSAAVISGVTVASTMLRTSFQTTGSCNTATRGHEVNVTNFQMTRSRLYRRRV